MTELKTLKDVPFDPTLTIDYPAGQYFTMEDKNKITAELTHEEYVVALRETAKEWVQALKDSLAEGLVEEHIMKRDAKIEWIETFFNLEDDDE